MRLLVVDPDPATRDCFSVLASPRRIDLAVCGTLPEALSAMERSPFDVVAVGYPDPGGKDLRLFGTCAERGSSVLLLLPSDEAFGALERVECFAEDFAVKPLDPAAVGARLELIRRRRAASRGERALLGAVPDLVFWLKRDGTYLRCHAPRPELLIAPAEELLGRTVGEMLPPEFAATLHRHLEEAFERGAVDLEYELDVQAGKCQFQGRMVRAGPDEVIIIARDVTAERAAMSDLATSQDRLHVVLSALPDSIIRFTSDGTMLDYIARTRTPMAARAAEVPGKKLLELPDLLQGFSREIVEITWEAGRKALETGEMQTRVQAFEVEGELRWMEVRFVRFGPDEVLGISRDVTEARRAAEEQRDIARLKQAFANRILEVQEEERRHLARELHDVIGQRLLVHRLDAEWLVVHSSDPEAARMAEGLCRLLDETLQMVRSLAHGLRPPVLDDLGIASALEQLTKQIATRTGIRCLCSAEEVIPPVPSELAVALYRIAQEALTNAVRHAGCRTIELQLRRSSDRLVLAVRDDGCGIDLARIEDPRSFGLVGMRERAAQVGGMVRIGRAPAGGTLVAVELPLETM